MNESQSVNLFINVIIFQAKSTHHPVAFALVMVNVGAMPNRTFETQVMENEANTMVFDLRVCYCFV